jgi:hypothetical protein
MKKNTRKHVKWAPDKECRKPGKGVLTKLRGEAIFYHVRVAARFFSGVPHPHLLGVCRPNFFCERLDVTSGLP